MGSVYGLIRTVDNIRMVHVLLVKVVSILIILILYVKQIRRTVSCTMWLIKDVRYAIIRQLILMGSVSHVKSGLMDVRK